MAKISMPPNYAIYFPFSNKYTYGKVVGANNFTMAAQPSFSWSATNMLIAPVY
jgi:hypothetical protein